MDFISMDLLLIDDKDIFKFIIIRVGSFFSWRSSNYCCHMHFDWRLISGFCYSDPFMWIFILFTYTKSSWLLKISVLETELIYRFSFLIIDILSCPYSYWNQIVDSLLLLPNPIPKQSSWNFHSDYFKARELFVKNC